MKFQLFALIFCSVLADSTTVFGSLVRNRIIGGVDSGESEFPYQVSVTQLQPMGGKTHICGGVIYNETIILTSALCISGRDTNLIVLAGTNDFLNTDQRAQTGYVAKVVKHPSFNTTSLDFDLAYLKLTAPLTFNSRVQPIPILGEKEHEIDALVSGTEVITVGWGNGDPDWTMELNSNSAPRSAFTSLLQKIRLQIIDREECIEKFQGKYQISQNMICAYSHGKGVCARDAGGPLICRQTTNFGQDFLCGIISFGIRPCASSEFPTVFTNVTQFGSWLQSEFHS